VLHLHQVAQGTSASAINAFAFMTERLRPVELQITDDEEIPF
jgi:hypothetical protein